MKTSVLTAALAAASLGACSYQVPTMSAPQLDVYSNYQDRVPGKWALVVEDDAFKKDIHAEGLNCAAHNYPLDLTSSFKQSAVATFQNITTNVDVLDRPIPTESLTAAGYAGEIEIKAEDMRSRLMFIPGFWSSTAESDIELDAAVVVNGSGGRLMGTRATGKGTESSDAGQFCGGATDAVAHSSEAAMKDVLGEIGERFSNAPQVRNAGTETFKPPATKK